MKKMDKIFNWISVMFGLIGGVLSYWLGGWDVLLKTIVFLAVVDYITGVIKGIYTKKLSSETGFKGLLKKIVMFIVVKKRWEGKVVPFFLGLLSYVIFVFICVNLIMSAFALIPSVDMAFSYNQHAYTIVYCVVASVAFLAARVVLGNMITQRYDTRGDVYMAGMGLGIGDGILYGVTAVSYYVWCIAIRNEGLEQAFQGLSNSDITSTYESVSTLFNAPIALWLLMGLGCIMDMLIHFALTNATYGVITGSLPKYWYALSTGIYFVNAISFQLYDSSSMVSIAVSFAIKLIIFAASMYYTLSVAGKQIKYGE